MNIILSFLYLFFLFFLFFLFACLFASFLFSMIFRFFSSFSFSLIFLTSHLLFLFIFYFSSSPCPRLLTFLGDISYHSLFFRLSSLIQYLYPHDLFSSRINVFLVQMNNLTLLSMLHTILEKVGVKERY